MLSLVVVTFGFTGTTASHRRQSIGVHGVQAPPGQNSSAADVRQESSSSIH